MLITGTVYTLPGELKISKAGKQYLPFTIKESKSDIYFKILCFGEDQIKRLKAEKLEHGTKIIVELKAFDTNAGHKKNGDLESYMLQSYSLPGKPKSKSSLERDKAEAQKIHRDTIADKEAKGLRFVDKNGLWQWRPIAECIEVLTEKEHTLGEYIEQSRKWVWKDRLEFCQEVLGDSKVYQLLFGIGSPYTISSVPKLTEFQKAVNEILPLAVNDYGMEKCRGFEVLQQESCDRPGFEIRQQEGVETMGGIITTPESGGDYSPGETNQD